VQQNTTMGNITTTEKTVNRVPTTPLVPIDQLDALVGHGCLERYQPYDVFIVHTGEQKRLEVDTMAHVFHTNGILCFLDHEMMNVDGSPLSQMRSALLSCRYAVAVVSHSFLQKKVPMEELEYSFRRMKWMRKNQLWNSLLIVLVDLSVDEFRRHSKLTSDICGEIVLCTMNDYSGSWSQLCRALVGSMSTSDKEGAMAQWTEFLKHIGSYSDLPLPNTLYEN